MEEGTHRCSYTVLTGPNRGQCPIYIREGIVCSKHKNLKLAGIAPAVSANHCNYIITRGENKGERCSKTCKGDRCAKHKEAALQKARDHYYDNKVFL